MLTTNNVCGEKPPKDVALHDKIIFEKLSQSSRGKKERMNFTILISFLLK